MENAGLGRCVLCTYERQRDEDWSGDGKAATACQLRTGCFSEARTSMKIPWKYCECGCKSSCVTLAGIHFSAYDDLRGGHYLSVGNHCQRAFGKPFKSQKEVDAQVRVRLAERKSELLAELKELEGI